MSGQEQVVKKKIYPGTAIRVVLAQSAANSVANVRGLDQFKYAIIAYPGQQDRLLAAPVQDINTLSSDGSVTSPMRPASSSTQASSNAGSTSSSTRPLPDVQGSPYGSSTQSPGGGEQRVAVEAFSPGGDQDEEDFLLGVPRGQFDAAEAAGAQAGQSVDELYEFVLPDAENDGASSSSQAPGEQTNLGVPDVQDGRSGGPSIDERITAILPSVEKYPIITVVNIAQRDLIEATNLASTRARSVYEQRDLVDRLREKFGNINDTRVDVKNVETVLKDLLDPRSSSNLVRLYMEIGRQPDTIVLGPDGEEIIPPGTKLTRRKINQLFGRVMRIPPSNFDAAVVIEEMRLYYEDVKRATAILEEATQIIDRALRPLEENNAILQSFVPLPGKYAFLLPNQKWFPVMASSLFSNPVLYKSVVLQLGSLFSEYGTGRYRVTDTLKRAWLNWSVYLGQRQRNELRDLEREALSQNLADQIYQLRA